MISVTGSLQDLFSNAVGGGTVTFALSGYDTVPPRVAGTSIVVSPSVTVNAGTNGAFTATIYGNDSITPAGTTYTVTFKNASGITVGINNYTIVGTGSVDISFLKPNNNVPPPATVQYVSQFMIPVVLLNPKFVSGYLIFSGTGAKTVYTAPANRRALISGGLFSALQTGGQGTLSIISNSVEYQLNKTAVLSLGQMGIFRVTVPYVLEPGEIVAVRGSPVGTYNVWISIIEFDATSNLFTKKLTGSGIVSGTNATLYTVTSGKTGYVINPVTPFFGFAGQSVSGQASFEYFNGVSGGSVTFNANLVPSSGTAGITNQIIPATTVASNTYFSASVNPFPTISSMNSGDSLVINATGTLSSGQIAYVTAVEV